MSKEKTIIPRKAFEVYINNKTYDVYDIEGKEHGGYNDTPKTWWVYYSDRLPEGTLPPIDSDSWHPYCVGTKRLCWDIRMKQTNSTKHKWGELQFNNHTHVEMWCNGKLIYSFGTFGTSFAFAKIQYLQTMLMEHPYNFLDSHKEQGRKIYWYGLPATVDVKKHSSWEIGIVPDYTDGLTKEQWWKEYNNRRKKLGNTKKAEWDLNEETDEEIDNEEASEDMKNDYINWGDALSDQYIDWFRH